MIDVERGLFVNFFFFFFKTKILTNNPTLKIIETLFQTKNKKKNFQTHVNKQSRAER